jgi:hypothetical protein
MLLFYARTVDYARSLHPSLYKLSNPIEIL